MEGVAKNKVRLLPHNPQWENGAKPILDIAVQLKSIENMNKDVLIDMGYDYRGPQFGNRNYHLFVLRGDDQISLRHIHCYDKAEKEFGLLVSFRDYLNTHIEDALEYEKIKKEYAEKYPDDRSAYTAGKEKFILSIYSKL